MVSCRKAPGGNVRIEISDDGVGLPEGVDPIKSEEVEPRCLFINVDVAEAGPAKAARRCQPTHAGADDCNRQIFAGHAPPPLRAGRVNSLFGILG
jgi:hypothetical protein